MDTLTAIATRHSTREFSPAAIPKEIIEKIVDAGRRAPTARNEQPWEFIVITDAHMRKRLGDMADHGRFLAHAPTCIVVICRETKYYLEDGCAAVENILLAATALGVQSCWVAGDKKDYAPAVLQMLRVPPEYRLVALLALGYSANHNQPKVRRPLEAVLHWEMF